MGVQVAMPDDQGAGVAPVQVVDQSPHGCLLRLGARVGGFILWHASLWVGLTPDIESALVADADRVGVVVQAVGTHHPLRTAWLYRSVTTDHVMVADAELIMPVFAVP